MTHLDLFSGIGGFALAADWVWPGIEHIFCDNDKFCQQVLSKHWPNSKIYGDIRTLRFDTNPDSNGQCGGEKKINSTERGEQTFNDSEKCDGTLTNTPDSGCRETTSVETEKGYETQSEHNRELEGGLERPFILTGGFPCQPFSQAGRRRGTDDNRYLWPEMFRVIREFSPLWVIAENVGGLVTWNEGLVLQQVCTDLESEGYEVQPLIIPAVSVNAPHRRDRVWIIANKSVKGLEGHTRYDSKRERTSDSSERDKQDWERNWTEVAAELCRVDDGLPAELDFAGWSKSRHRVERLKSLGNAIVPQVAYQIMKSIKEDIIN